MSKNKIIKSENTIQTRKINCNDTKIFNVRSFQSENSAQKKIIMSELYRKYDLKLF